MKRALGRLLCGAAAVAVIACNTPPNALVDDAPPVLTIAAPDDFYVARPSLRVAASCLDDAPNGCVSLTVTAGAATLATAQGSIDQTVSLAAYDGQSLDLVFEGRDAAGQVTTRSRRVFVESSSHLTEVASVNGLIMDVQPDRILFLNQSTGGDVLTIRDRSSGNDVIGYDQTGHRPRHGFLTPLGAIFLEQSGAPSNYYQVHEWQPGGLTDLGGLTSLLVVKDHYAVFKTTVGLIRRDLLAGANVVISTDATDAYYDVAANGDVAYWVSSPSGQVFRFRGGISTQLTNDAMGNMHPVTDGLNVVYMKNQQVTSYDASGEHVLTPGDGYPRAPLRDYRATNGWVAYTKIGAGGVLQVWIWSPTEADTQLTYVGTSKTIDALGPNGEVVLSSTVGGVSRRYLAVPDYSTAPSDISSSLGSAFFQAGNLFVAIGRSLFQVNP